MSDISRILEAINEKVDYRIAITLPGYYYIYTENFDSIDAIHEALLNVDKFKGLLYHRISNHEKKQYVLLMEKE